MKPVPITPIIGTSVPVFPLDSVGTWFQIMQKIPGYRNHFVREVGIALPRFKLLVWKTRLGDMAGHSRLTERASQPFPDVPYEPVPRARSIASAASVKARG
jgi:hypothetical protein